MPYSNSLLLLLTLFFISLPSWAQEIPLTEVEGAVPAAFSSIISNLVYYPHRGKVLLFSQFSNAIDLNGDSSNDKGNVSVSQSEYYALGLSLTYGVTSRLRLSVSMQDELRRQNHSTDRSGFVTTTTASGVNDPILGLQYRVIETSNFQADISATVSTSFGPQVAALSDKDGNNRLGGWASSLAMPLYWVRENTEIELTPMVGRSFGTHIEGTTLSSTRSRSPYWNGSLSLQDRVHLTRSYFLQPGVTATLPNGSIFTNATVRQQSTKDQEPFVPRWQLLFGYTAKPGVLLSAAVESYEYHSRMTPRSGNTIQTRNSQTMLNLQARFEF